IVDPVAQHALVAIEDLAVPERLADGIQRDPLQLQRASREPAHDLGDAEFAAAASREQDLAVEGTVGNWPGRKARVDLVDLLLRQRRKIRRRDLREIGGKQWKLVLDFGQIHLLPDIGTVGRELDVRRARLEPVTTSERYDDEYGKRNPESGAHGRF